MKKYESPKGYTDLFDNAEALEDELDEMLKMKEYTPLIVVETIMKPEFTSIHKEIFRAFAIELPTASSL